MTGEASAYAALGLELGADASAVEQAYRRLIKEHHPDRTGGDARRAAEINRAYRELRAERELKDPLQLIDAEESNARRGGGWIAVGLLAVIAAAGLMLSDGFATIRAMVASAGHANLPDVRRTLVRDPMDQPLNLSAIDDSAGDALRIARTRDEMSLASASSDCHRQLRRAPSLLQLDRCAAFDDAVIELQDRDPLRDQGPFSELAVTGRVWSAATALSEDSVAIDGRLDRIRMRVEIALAPFVDPTKPPPAAKD